MPAGRHTLGRAEVTVGDDGVRLADGTLAGSNLAMDQGVRNLAAFSGCPAAAALHAASTAPAELLGDTIRGTLAPGARADLVLLTHDLQLVATVVGGEVLHDARAAGGTPAGAEPGRDAHV
jgi:N-acetylglucosamine-6-phosphate deacetylase